MDNYRLIRNLVLQYMEENLTRLKDSQEDVIKEILQKLQEQGYRITPQIEDYVSQIISRNADLIKALIARSALLATQHLGIPQKTKEVLREIEKHEYPDGLNVSKRLWKRQKELKHLFKTVLFRNMRARESARKIAYEFQYKAEKRPFEDLTKEDLPKLIEDLRATARRIIQGEEDRAEWERLIRRYEKYIQKRSKLGTYYAHKTLLRDLTNSVEELSDRAIESALRWWAYDKQLYYLNRIARTEVSNVIHLSILKETEKDPYIIGYRWELSPAHKRPDICDHLASVDFGLGRGVFPKGKIPRRKPHPHCTCHITPIAGDPEKVKVKNKSLKDHIRENPQVYEQWISTRKWARDLHRKGVPLEEFFDPRTLRMKTREEMRDWERLIEAKGKVEEILGTQKSVNVKVGQRVQISRYPKKEKVRDIVKDPFGYEFFYTDYRVKHSLRVPSSRDRRKRKLKEMPYLKKAWRNVGKRISSPDGIAIYKGGQGLTYAVKVEDKYVYFPVDPRKRVIDTAFVKSSLNDTENYIFIWRKGE